MENSHKRDRDLRIKSPLALPPSTPVIPATSAPTTEHPNSPGSVSGSALRCACRAADRGRCGDFAADPKSGLCVYCASGHDPAKNKYLTPQIATQPGTPVEEVPRPERPRCDTGERSRIGGGWMRCRNQIGHGGGHVMEHEVEIPPAPQPGTPVEEAPRPERSDPAICTVRFCGRACGPGDSLCRKHGGNTAACGICGSLTCPGHIVSSGQRLPRADAPPLPAVPRIESPFGAHARGVRPPYEPTTLRYLGNIRDLAGVAASLGLRDPDPKLAAWQHHAAICDQCQTAPSSAGLCLAGAALATAAGLTVPDGATIAQALQSVAPPDPKHPRHLKTSELLRRCADLLEQDHDGVPRFGFEREADELRIRAADFERMAADGCTAGGYNVAEVVLRAIGEVRA